MISDGIMPTNEGRGYVLRRLIRRAARHGRLLGIEGTFLAKLSETGDRELQRRISGTGGEERVYLQCTDNRRKNQFNKTIDQGLRILSDMEEDMKKAGEKTLSGDNAFKLYDTYGFPLDLTKRDP